SSTDSGLCWQPPRDGGVDGDAVWSGGKVSFAAVVVDIAEESRRAGRQQWLVLLDRTEFRVGDVGTIEAVARSGARLSVPVLGVVEREKGIWHQVEKPLLAGTHVTGYVTAGSAIS